MILENLVFDAVNPTRLGLFWQELLGGEQLTDNEQGFETRLAPSHGPGLDLCFQPVPADQAGASRVYLELCDASPTVDLADRARQLGARNVTGQGRQPNSWADPEGNEFRILATDGVPAGPGPLAAIRLDSARPRDAARFWRELIGWHPMEGTGPLALSHPSRQGPLLVLVTQISPKGQAKNRIHLDLRLDHGQDAETAAGWITRNGGVELQPDWGSLPWRIFADPSGNEFCVLPAPREPGSG
ncbi:VOC family protein [Glutamicibacter sp. MNS18]|uniref:VOC family protein n=1 Tax=Glutamicibacter sp. MNS18 TaxID=2989817 RepID=UPI0022369A0D|nr:VOC family protein [Glutamicibacter sp. MNS18]MCW4464298.1 VOC family protein [Glutamicibacter sp. MNS18]